MLYYLGQIPHSRLAEIRTPNDVFYEATKRLMTDGIVGASKEHEAHKLKAQHALLLLAAIAFEMSVGQRNFDGLKVKDVLTGLENRCQAHSAGYGPAEK